MSWKIDTENENVAGFLVLATIILGLFKFTALCLVSGALVILFICSQIFDGKIKQFFKDISEIAKNISKNEENPDS